MRSAILLSSVAVAALATPAFAGPGDRDYEQGVTCSSAEIQCLQKEFSVDSGGRTTERAQENGSDRNFSGVNTATRADDGDEPVGEEVGDSIDNAADETGDAISHAADEAGDEIGDAANEAGDAIDHVGDEIGDAFD